MKMTNVMLIGGLAIITGVILVSPETMLDACLGDTMYAPNFTKSAFRKICSGMSRDEVVSILGEPLFVQRNYVIYYYELDAATTWAVALRSDKVVDEGQRKVCAIYSRQRHVVDANTCVQDTEERPGPGKKSWPPCRDPVALSHIGKPEDRLRLRLGTPARIAIDNVPYEVWHFSKSITHSHHLRFLVHFDVSSGKCSGTSTSFYWD